MINYCPNNVTPDSNLFNVSKIQFAGHGIHIVPKNQTHVILRRKTTPAEP